MAGVGGEHRYHDLRGEPSRAARPFPPPWSARHPTPRSGRHCSRRRPRWEPDIRRRPGLARPGVSDVFGRSTCQHHPRQGMSASTAHPRWPADAPACASGHASDDPGPAPPSATGAAGHRRTSTTVSSGRWRGRERPRRTRRRRHPRRTPWPTPARLPHASSSCARPAPIPRSSRTRARPRPTSARLIAYHHVPPEQAGASPRTRRSTRSRPTSTPCSRHCTNTRCCCGGSGWSWICRSRSAHCRDVDRHHGPAPGSGGRAVAGAPDDAILPWTAFVARRRPNLRTAAGDPAAPEAVAGLLDLAQPDTFDVIQVDIDSATLKGAHAPKRCGRAVSPGRGPDPARRCRPCAQRG